MYSKFKSGYFINILSDAFLTNTYYKEFREFLIAELDIFELCLTLEIYLDILMQMLEHVLFLTKKLQHIVFNNYQKENKIKLIDRLLSENEYNTNKNRMILQEEIKNTLTHKF